MDIGISTPKLLLPKKNIDVSKWAVIACDQFTSEPEYWHQVKEIVGDAPSTFHMILPEVYLGTPEENDRIEASQEVMSNYLKTDIFQEINDFIYVLRTINGRTRRGLMVCLDLENYDFHKGSQTLIRATEGTILDRLPPRIQIRENAPLECPHILVLFDDPNDTVFSPLDEQIMDFEEVYNFELMLGSGRLRGLVLQDDKIKNHIKQSLQNLIDPETFADKYNLKSGAFQPLLFAMGDGNHSLATAKAIWEKIKPTVGIDHPARYALVEIENIHDPALTFEPIHRLLFDIESDLIEEMKSFWQENFRVKEIDSVEVMKEIVDEANEPWHQIGMINSDGIKLIEVRNPIDNLPVGSLQKFLDHYLVESNSGKIDYVHGTDVLFEKGILPGNTGFYVPGIDKSELFKTVILDGALPRKTFSMGEAKEKRFYLECRRIKFP